LVHTKGEGEKKEKGFSVMFIAVYRNITDPRRGGGEGERGRWGISSSAT